MQSRLIAERAIARLRKRAQVSAPLFDTRMLDDIQEDFIASIEWTYDQRRKEIIDNAEFQKLPQESIAKRIRPIKGRFVKRDARDGNSRTVRS